MKLTVLLDMDGVVADFTPKLLEMYNYLTGENIKISDIRSNKVEDYVGDPFLIKKIKDSTGFIRGLNPSPGSLDAVNSMVKMGCDVVFVSNSTYCPSSGFEKREWLGYYFSKTWKKAPLILTHEKFRIRGDLLVDDDLNNLNNLHSTTKPILWHQPYNASCDLRKTNIERMYSWDQLIDWIERNG